MADTTTAYSLMIADLGYTGTDIPAETKTLMEAKLAAALVQLAAKGITLDLAAPTDNELLSAYAAWMYRQRASESPMPTYLRYALNNRIVRRCRPGCASSRVISGVRRACTPPDFGTACRPARRSTK